MRVLVIEDDSATALGIELMLKTEGFNVYTTDLGEEGIDLAKIYEFDVITLDGDLPDMNGLDVLRALRLAKVATPIVMLTAHSAIEMKVAALNMGADDYMEKPFHKFELVARLHAVARRSQGHATSNITVGDVEVNIEAKIASVAGKRLKLTGKEFGMLELMALRKNSCISKVGFMNHLYGGLDEPEPKIVDVFICKLRKKLREAGAGKAVQTIWGRGYALVEPGMVAA